MDSDSKSTKGTNPGLAARDRYVVQAYALFNSFQLALTPKTNRVISGGGIHVGPPRSIETDDLGSPNLDYSFDLTPITGYDDIFEKGLKKILGGNKVTYVEDGSEVWPNPKPYP